MRNSVHTYTHIWIKKITFFFYIGFGFCRRFLSVYFVHFIFNIIIKLWYEAKCIFALYCFYAYATWTHQNFNCVYVLTTHIHSREWHSLSFKVLKENVSILLATKQKRNERQNIFSKADVWDVCVLCRHYVYDFRTLLSVYFERERELTHLQSTIPKSVPSQLDSIESDFENVKESVNTICFITYRHRYNAF